MNLRLLNTNITTSMLKPLIGTAVLACCAGLSACGGSSSNSNGSGTSATESAMTRDEIGGCTAVAGPLDTFQEPLAERLVTGLADLPVGATSASLLASLVVEVLDLVDSLALSAGSLATLPSGGDPSLIPPVYHQLLCVTGSVVELILSPLVVPQTLADQEALQGLLGEVAHLQQALMLGSQTIPDILSLDRVFEDLGFVTQTLSGVVANLAGITGALPGDIGGSILMPVATLLYDVTAALNVLSDGDTQAFAHGLTDSVTHLLDGLAANLGPLGIVLTPLSTVLGFVLDGLATLLGGLLGILL